MISVVCVYNSEKILNDYLLKSLKNQTVDYELITVDNTKGKFKSAAEALNRGGKKANGKYLMFVHQDVDLCSSSWLEDAGKILDAIPDLGIAGVAGNVGITGVAGMKAKKSVMTLIKHGDPPRWAGSIIIKKPEEVQTLDECLFIIPKSVFKSLQFDEKICDDWHLYAVDYCLSVKRIGYDVYAIPMYVYHLSPGIKPKNKLQIVLDLGPFPKGYYLTMKKLLQKHKGYYKRIYATGDDWNTSFPLILQRVLYLAKAGIRIPFKKL